MIEDKDKDRDYYVTAKCPVCGRFMRKVTVWYCPYCNREGGVDEKKKEVEKK